MTREELKIDGMSCGHCVATVKQALQEVPGLRVADVAVGSAVVDVDPSRVSRSAIASALDAAGYTLVEPHGEDG